MSIQRKMLWQEIKFRIQYAREQHPDWAGIGPEKACDIILGEVNEFRKAVNSESEERQIDEALDVIATCCRFLLGEYKAKEKKPRARKTH